MSFGKRLLKAHKKKSISQEVSNMLPKEREHVFAILDAFIATTKFQGCLAIDKYKN